MHSYPEFYTELFALYLNDVSPLFILTDLSLVNFYTRKMREHIAVLFVATESSRRNISTIQIQDGRPSLML